MTQAPEYRLYPSGRYELCLGPSNYFPPPGAVDLDMRARCPGCGERVSVTKRGNYRKHRRAK